MTAKKNLKFLKSVLQIDIDTKEIINKFNSIKEASEKTGSTHISSVCNGKQKTSGGYIWKYFENQEILEENLQKNKYSSNEYNNLQDKLFNKWNEDYKNKINIGSINRWLCSQNENFDKKQRIFELEKNNLVCSELCLVCKVRKPLTPVYFMIGKNFHIDCISGREDLINKPNTGCRECNKKFHKEKRKECSKTFTNGLLKNFSKLNLDWYNSHKNICAISNISLIESSNSVWTVSIQNNNTNTDHLPENCIKIAYEFNVPELNSIKKDLVTTYKDEIFPEFIKELLNPSDTTNLIKYLIEWYNKTPSENGVTAKSRTSEYENQLRKYHLKYILKAQVKNCKNADKNSKNKKRLETKQIDITKEILLNKLINQNMKCYYTGIPFSIDRDNWNFWSLERLDNNKNHTEENTVFICRIFNTYGQLNRKKLLYALLNQIHIPLSNDVKIKIEEELKIL